MESKLLSYLEFVILEKFIIKNSANQNYQEANVNKKVLKHINLLHEIEKRKRQQPKREELKLFEGR